MREIIAMHGWAGNQHQWSNWIDFFNSSNWIWHSADRGYRDLSPYIPNWRNKSDSNSYMRVVICHSLGSHLIANNILSTATHIVLVNSFSSFIPIGKESRSIIVALNGMMKAIGTEQEDLMMLNFYKKAYKPNEYNKESTDLTSLNLSDSGRLRLKNDLKLLFNSNSLPIGLTKGAQVLVINSEEDYILSKTSKKKLIKDLRYHLNSPPTVMKIKEEGHTLSNTTVIEKIKYWLESNHASTLARASK